MRSLLLAMAACLCFAPGPLYAQALAHGLAKLPQPSAQRSGRHVELIVDDTGTGLATGVLDLPIDPDGHTMIYFPEDIEHANSLPSRYFRVDVAEKRAMIYALKRRFKPDARRAVTLASPSIAIDLLVRSADNAGEVVSMVTVRRRSEMEVQEAALATQRHALEEERQKVLVQQGELEAERQKLSTQQRELERATADAMDTMAESMLINDRRLETVLVETGRDSDLARVSLGHGRWFDSETFYFPIQLHYRGTRPFLAKRIEVVDAAGRPLDVTLIGMGSPATARNGILTELQPGEHTQGVIKLSGMAQSSLEGLTIRLIDATGLPAIVAMTQPWDISPPYEQVFPGQREARERERRRRELDERERDKVSLHLQGVYGAVWLGDGAGLDKSDATHLTGLGVRAQYAFNRWLAFEGEVMGASTGEARFEGVMYEGAQGDLTRSASLGRAQFGGVLRFGQGTYVPLARLGVGLQGASHRGTLTTATGEAPGPDAFEFDLLWYAGVGVDVRVGPLVAGLSLAGAKGEGQSIEAGIHLGYAWKP